MALTLPTYVTSYIHYLAVGTLPPHNALQQVSVIGSGTELSPSGIHKDADLCIGAGLPPIPPRLVTRIEAGEFIDMAELLPAHLGPATTELLPKSSKRRHDVSNILEWIKCFSAYIAVISAKQPHRVPDLLGYLTMITEAHMQYAGDGWMGYDRRFRQIAATKPHAPWAQIDTTLWNLAFSGKARSVRCKFCFSITHTSTECELAPDQGSNSSGTQSQHQASVQPVTPYPVSSRRRRICMLYNYDSTPGCSFPNCKFEHICFLCADDPRAIEKGHKAVMCPHHSTPSSNGEPLRKWNSPRFYTKLHPYHR